MKSLADCFSSFRLAFRAEVQAALLRLSKPELRQTDLHHQAATHQTQAQDCPTFFGQALHTWSRLAASFLDRYWPHLVSNTFCLTEQLPIDFCNNTLTLSTPWLAVFIAQHSSSNISPSGRMLLLVVNHAPRYKH